MRKLGAGHLPPGFDGPMDRKVAADPHMALVRLRMQQIARLLAEALLTPLADAPDAPLHLVNIAGGPALDSINALIMLARAHATLINRPITIHVFDVQEKGPIFGARALLALTAPGKPLHGLEIQFQHHAYDWNDTAPLALSSSELRTRMIAQTRFRFFARGLEGFAPLAERGGYAIAESRTAIMSDQVLLRPRDTLPPPPSSGA